MEKLAFIARPYLSFSSVERGREKTIVRVFYMRIYVYICAYTHIPTASAAGARARAARRRREKCSFFISRGERERVTAIYFSPEVHTKD